MFYCCSQRSIDSLMGSPEGGEGYSVKKNCRHVDLKSSDKLLILNTRRVCVMPRQQLVSEAASAAVRVSTNNPVMNSGRVHLSPPSGGLLLDPDPAPLIKKKKKHTIYWLFCVHYVHISLILVVLV